MWIRSQDKTALTKVSHLHIRDIYGLGDTERTIYAISDGQNNLAVYNTTDRALEVLDEIQDLLKHPNMHYEEDITYYMPSDGSSKVYEMPEE